MKRKSKPLITGGLLGLAGLGLLPRGAEANTDLPPVVPDPSLGAAQANEPNPVVVPEPSAQTTEPQIDDQNAAQPAWTPESEQSVAIAAAASAPTVAATPQPAEPPAVEEPVAAAIPQPEPPAVEKPVAAAIPQPEPPAVEEPVAAIPQPEPPTIEKPVAAAVPQPDQAAPEIVAAAETNVSTSAEADSAAPDTAIAVSTATAPVAIPAPGLAPAETAASEPAAKPTAAVPPAVSDDNPSAQSTASALSPQPPQPEVTLPEPTLPEAIDSAAPATAAIANPAAPAPATTPTVRPEAAETSATNTPPAELLPAIAPKPSASKPQDQITQRSETAPAQTTPAVALEADLEHQSGAAAVAIAPAPSLDATRSVAPQPSPAAYPLPRSSRQTAPDLATLRSRAATVQALLQDLRTAYGLDSQVIPARPVSEPETVSRGPQLPPLPSRSARRRTTPGAIAQVQKPAAIPAVSQPVASQNDQPGATREPQLPALSGQAPNITLALPNPKPVMSTGQSPLLPVAMSAASLSPDSSVAPAPAQDAAPNLGQNTAQGESPDSTADQVRDELRIEPLTTAADPAETFPPSPSAGIPSAFGAGWGDLFISASLSGADRLRAEADGSLSMGFGIGDSRRAVGVEFAYNLQSIRNFGDNGGFDVKVHREVYSDDETQVAAAVGWNNFASYGSNAAGTGSSPYGIVTAAHLLQPDHPTNRLPMTASLGLGGGNFGGDNHDVGVIAGVGLQVHPQFSINTAWSGVGVNVGASIVPVATIPLTLNLLYGDVGNNTRAGSVAVLSIGYGFNFGPQF